ncbi:hypothetical protein [Streptomyces sp. NPDC096323]|uniref:hypothetical protein n=1 Tax=Streptomyces sp. NPDC096323 TaxID=3155822 RepID=UPI00331C1D38
MRLLVGFDPREAGNSAGVQRLDTKAMDAALNRGRDAGRHRGGEGRRHPFESFETVRDAQWITLPTPFMSHHDHPCDLCADLRV